MSIEVAMARIATIVVMLLLALPAAAMASGDTVLRDCGDDQELSRAYSQAEYKQALAHLPADLDEYTDCRAIIRAAQLANASKSGSNSGSGDQTRKLSKRKRDALKDKVSKAAATKQPLKLGNSVVHPGSFNSSSSIPAPLIVVLLLTLLGALGAGAIVIRRIVLDRRNH